MSAALAQPTGGRRYERRGILAIEPKAFFDLFGSSTPANEPDDAGLVESVFIRGPLDHHDDGWCDSYDAIARRVKSACEGPAQTIVLRIDSPGGDVMGCFETSRAIREMVKAADKTLLAHVDGSACSAAYAIACSADRIYAAPSARLGSIGVIATRHDFTGMDEKFGVKIAIVTSGARKADGHPSMPITTAELAELQSCVDAYAAQFFALVAELRGGLEAAPLQAAVFSATDAQGVRLADEVQSFESLLAMVASGGIQMASKLEEGRAALEEAAKGEGEEAEKAKRALAAMDEEDETEEEESSAEGDEPEEEPDEEEAAAAGARVPASAAAALVATTSDSERRLAAVEQRLERQERAELFASRPDIPAGVVKALAGVPLAEVRKIVAATPKPKTPKPAATATVQATRGEGQGNADAPRLPPNEKLALDRRMGLVATKPGVEERGNKLVLGVAMPLTEKGA